MKPSRKTKIKSSLNILFCLLFPLIYVYKKNRIPMLRIENERLKFILLYLWLPVSAVMKWLIVMLPHQIFVLIYLEIHTI